MTALRLQGLRPLVHAAPLEPVDLALEAGDTVLLSGPSGAGKSLLLRAIADLDPSGGEVFLAGAPRSGLRATEWRRRVGLLPAESGWWTDRVADHFPADDDGGKAGQRVQRLLSALGFGADVLDWDVTRLSTGERQRLALARLLANGPEALLLDEPTANLDPANRERAEALIMDYRERHGAPLLWVSHDPDQRERLAAAADGRRLVIAGRRLRPEGDA
jgi:ABC-type iron transport system FetAB ATPase subunit